MQNYILKETLNTVDWDCLFEQHDFWGAHF